MASLCQKIANKYVINPIKCHKLLSQDGITTQDLVVNKVEGLYEGISVNLKSQKGRFASLGRAASIAKNLDEYQYIICHEIGSLHDGNPFKKELQKFRIMIIASFAKLIPILTSLLSDKEIQEWNRFALMLLNQVSETLLKTRNNQKYDKPSNENNLRSAFDFFGIVEQDVDDLLQNIYSFGDRGSIQ